MNQAEQNLKKVWERRPRTTVNYANPEHCRWNNELLLAVKAWITPIVTIQTPGRAPAAPDSPSNAAPPAPEMERSSDSPGIAAAPEKTADSADRSAAVDARLLAAKKASAKRVITSKRASKAKAPPAPPAIPTATPASDGF